MKNDNFTYSFSSARTPDAVFEQLLHVEQWWSGFFEETITGKSQVVNDEFIFKAGGGAHYSKQKLIELEPNRKIVWQVTDSDLNFLNKTDEWTGSKLQFNISTEGNKTKVVFTHEGLVPGCECWGDCSGGWMKYLEKLNKTLN